MATVKYISNIGFKDLEEIGEIPTVMRIFDSHYIKPLPEPIVINLGDTVHVEVGICDVGVCQHCTFICSLTTIQKHLLMLKSSTKTDKKIG